MKNKISIILFITGLFYLSACTDLDLSPLSEGSSETWYSNESEIQMALNDLYRNVFWPQDNDEWTDDYTRRDLTNPINNATLNGEWSTVINVWKNAYKTISRANTVIANASRAEDLPQATIDKFVAEARFVRASQYAMLISHYGDVVYFTEALDLEESFKKSRTDKSTILQSIYEDFDFAAANLPTSYGSSQNMRASKGAALAMKARIALFYQDWSVARDAAKACIDLDTYELFADWQTLFLSKTKNPKELIFGMPRSQVLDVTTGNVKNWISRLAGGWGAAAAPSWDLFCGFLCSDGLPIDESPLFDPRDPFKNRDPRCTMSIVEFGTPWLGFIYQPHPDSLTTLNLNTGQMVKNNDTRGNQQYASFNGLMWKKGIDEDWADDYEAENEIFIMRYADVLLMYAEAKIELNEIDQTMLDASINTVRAQAYGVSVNDKANYPEILASLSHSDLRREIKTERRMEFANEGIRYMDIIRWRLAEKVLNYDIYGMLDVSDLRTKVIQPGLWFLPMIPEIDEDGIAVLEPMYNAGLCKLLALRDFDANRQYLWPIPSKEVLINENLGQNPGY